MFITQCFYEYFGATICAFAQWVSQFQSSFFSVAILVYIICGRRWIFLFCTKSTPKRTVCGMCVCVVCFFFYIKKCKTLLRKCVFFPKTFWEWNRGRFTVLRWESRPSVKICWIFRSYNKFVPLESYILTVI